MRPSGAYAKAVISSSMDWRGLSRFGRGQRERHSSRREDRAESKIGGATGSGCERWGKSWFRVRASIFRTAGFLCRSEFHELDASVVRIVEIELPFAVAADFGLLGQLNAVVR